jgi:hypothetical protein
MVSIEYNPNNYAWFHEIKAEQLLMVSIEYKLNRYAWFP